MARTTNIWLIVIYYDEEKKQLFEEIEKYGEKKDDK